MNAKPTKKPRSANPNNAESNDMLPEYRFDYSKVKPNRFAERVEKNRRAASNKSDRKAALLKHAGAIESQFIDTSLKVDELVYGK